MPKISTVTRPWTDRGSVLPSIGVGVDVEPEIVKPAPAKLAPPRRRRAPLRPHGATAVKTKAAVFALAVATLSLASNSARAIPCPAMHEGLPALAQLDSEVRLRFIQDHLRAQAHHARVWTGGWAIGYAASSAAQLMLAPLGPPSERVDHYVGAGTSAVGFVLLLAKPLHVMADSPALDARVVAAGADANSCAVLSEAEVLLVADAHDEAFGKSWLVHAGNAIFNAGSGLLLGLGFHHWAIGAIGAAFGEVVGEVMILTQPGGLVDDERHYRAGDLGDLKAAELSPWKITPVLGPNAYGLAWGAHF